MIERHNTVLRWLTDEYLIAEAAKGMAQLVRSRALLCAPAEYRQGIEARVIELGSRIVDTTGGHRMEIVMLNPMDTRKAALQELASQGVELLTPAI